MKFKIKYADQIVGFFVIFAVFLLVVIVFLLGSNQRWFSKDYSFTAVFESASGLSEGMPIQYKGFVVGKVKKYRLNNDDTITADILIQDTYYDRIREGSVLELNVSPIGLGSQMLIHPGKGENLLPEDSVIPLWNSQEAGELMRRGLVSFVKKDDTISTLISQASPLIATLTFTLRQINNAFLGTGDSPLTQTVGGLASTMNNVAEITGNSSKDIERVIANLGEISENLEIMSREFADPTGLVPKLVDPDGRIFDSLERSLLEVEGIFSNLEEASSMLKADFPQISILLSDLKTSLEKAQDVMDGLRNHPLLKGGIPEKVNTGGTGSSVRDMSF